MSTRVRPGARWSTTGALRVVAVLGLCLAALCGSLCTAELAAAAVETPETGQASEITATTATIEGVLAPNATAPPAEPGGVYSFFYNSQTSECQGGSYLATPEREVEAVPDLPKQRVSVKLSDLDPGAEYAFCLAIVHNGEWIYGSTVTFTTLTQAPTIVAGSETANEVGSAEATLVAAIQDGGTPTGYRLQYVSDTQFEASGFAGASEVPVSGSAEADAGAASTPVKVAVRVNGLLSSSGYHYRFLAKSSEGTATGEDATFTTSAASGSSASALPDNRAYELVSTAKARDVLYPDPPTVNEDPFTFRAFRASAEGNAMAYVAEPPFEGGNGAQGYGDQFLATRTPQGWVAEAITPAGAPLEAEYSGFSSDLSAAVVQNMGPNEISGGGPCDTMDLRTSDGHLHPLLPEAPSQSPCGVAFIFAGASADYSNVLFQSNAALTSGAVPSEDIGNLYDSVGGHVQLVNVLPGPNPAPDPSAVFGGPRNETEAANDGVNNEPAYSNVISADGSRIFWTDLNTHRIYMREDATRTVPISAGEAEYWTATYNGRFVFYTEGQGAAARLWRFNVARFVQSDAPEAEALVESREAVTGAGTAVQGVIGVNETGEEGEFVYFVAGGVLAHNANAEGDKASAGLPNLYLSRQGMTAFIATLAPGDDNLGEPLNNGFAWGDWTHNPGLRLAEVAPDGHAVGFTSTANLTGHDDRHVSELYVYNADSRELTCASCNPAGEPVGTGASVQYSWETPVSNSTGSVYMLRWLSEDGDRAFFDSEEALLPQVTDGRGNAYEWEREGTGSCRQAAGCLYVLSGGTSTSRSLFLDASTNGDDVFIASRADFTLNAGGEEVKLYDVRVDGGFPELSTACTGTGCQGLPSVPPAFATPASATFAGVGNFVPITAKKGVTSKRGSVVESDAAKLAKALRACRRKPRRIRATCEKRTRKRYSRTTKRGKQ
ncbi:MAG TPA: hypothetical protein VMU32_08560 [Solirubrobacteraceae bacterium]|nr:hypothetical protein [Solirubrobacteraceae bacterium]